MVDLGLFPRLLAQRLVVRAFKYCKDIVSGRLGSSGPAPLTDIRHDVSESLSQLFDGRLRVLNHIMQHRRLQHLDRRIRMQTRRGRSEERGNVQRMLDVGG